jgi:predicted phosphodiesterase
MKRVVAMGDLHCGHFSGLTPPPFQYRPGLGPDYLQARGAMQRECWNWFERTVAALQPVDVLIVNGDLIDGKGSRSGGTELVTGSLDQQADMAAACIREVKAKKVFCTAGTPYHVSADGEDMEAIAAERVGASFSGHEWVDVNGCIFDVKHKVGGSQIPHGRHTAMARERLWNQLWAEQDGAPKANVILRSHVHYFAFNGDADYLAMALPALQGFGSKYGSRQCSGIIHFGVVHFDVDERGGYTWMPHLLRIRSARPRAVKV